ncbi:GTPase domain-containing protein [Sanguibacter antarcticus]|uniref:Dynamin family protein n=1 Tax=Sanguibacter antarcticus TaxID=372484 RepID=A0A2A9E5X5_9MICO|nr:GTPase domain-containing protein [Sanguibacter antarcticus]PFG33632.1 dynamin family protein [Sanguibacter antarcticus]
MPDAPDLIGLGDDGTSRVAELAVALAQLRSAVFDLTLPLETVVASSARSARERILDQLDDYLLPRIDAVTAPLLVVVGGSTGAGKSTLVNSILGQHVTTPGALRPTTRSPVLAHHPLDAPWFQTTRIFPHLARATTVGPLEGDAPAQAAGTVGDRSLRLVATDVLPVGLAILDAPDIDSVVVGNRELAAQLLAAADLWLFVTTAARYADAVPWDLLREGAARRAQVAIVVDRVDPGAEVVRDHLREMLAEQGLGSSPVFLVPETALVDGMLPAQVVAPVSRWLTETGGDAASRTAVIEATRDGAIDDIAGRTMALADAADAQVAADARLRAIVTQTYAGSARDVADATSDGTMLRGEVLARWQDFVGTGDLMRAVEERIGMVRDKITGFFRGGGPAEPKVAVAISTNLEAIIFDAADRAAERTYGAWRSDGAGAPLLDGLELSRASVDLRSTLAGEIRAWQSDVLALVSERGADKRGRARVLAVGVNGLGAALMIVVFAQTGGLTGAEVGIAGGSALLAQRILEGVFGDDAVRSLARAAQAALLERVDRALDREAARFVALLDAVGSGAPVGLELRGAAQALQGASHRERAARAAAAAARPVPGPPEGDSVDGEQAAEPTGPQQGRLRGADLRVLDVQQPHGLEKEPARRGLLGRLWDRRGRA